jgi:hypothetical protein
MMQNAQVPQAVVHFDTPAYVDHRFASRIRQCREAVGRAAVMLILAGLGSTALAAAAIDVF